MKVLNINGFTVLYEKKESGIVNVRTIVNAGSINENNDEFGAAHYLEHMFFKGTKKHNYKELNRMTSKIGSVNAYTSDDRTVFHLNTLSENFSKAVNILTEMFFEPLFSEEEFNKEKTVILEEYQTQLDSPMAYFSVMSNEGFWGTKRGHKVVGNRNTILNMTLEKIIDFRNRNYLIDNMTFAVIGNISEDEVVNVFSDILANAPSIHFGKLNSSKIEFDPIDYSDLIFNHKSKQAVISLSHKAFGSIEASDNNYVQAITASAIGGGMHSLLFDRIREDLGLCYHVGTQSSEAIDAGIISSYCLLDKKNIDIAKEEMLKVLEKVKNEGFESELLTIAKNDILFDLASQTETSKGYGYCILDNYFVDGLNVYNYDIIKSKVMSVTNENVIEYANKIFTSDNLKYSEMTSYQD